MKNGILIVSGFAFYYWGFSYFEPIMLYIDLLVQYKLGSYFLTYILIGIPAFVATCLVNRELNFLKYLGLQSNIVAGLIAGTVFSLPMFAGGLLQSELATDISIPNLIAKTIFAGFFEELYFRGFLFGQLFRKTRLGFLPAIIVCSVIFAIGHLYQSQDPGVLWGVFITTFMGSVLFAWLFVEWNYNLWVAIFLHTLMNLSWHLFAVSENALGTASFNIYRGITIALTIVLTIIYKKRKGEKLSVNRQTLVFKTFN